MRKFTQREKILIYILLIVGIIFLGNFIVMKPILQRADNALSEKNAAMDKKQTVELELLEETKIEKKYEELTVYVKEHENDFGNILSNDEMERAITDYLEDCSITLRSTDIKQAESRILNEENIGDATITAASMNIEAIGTWTDFYKLFDKAAADENILISSYEMQDEDDVIRRNRDEVTDNSQLNFEDRKYIVNMTLDYYMGSER